MENDAPRPSPSLCAFTVSPCRGVVFLAKAIEYGWQELLGDAFAGVMDRQAHRGSGASEFEANRAARRRELNGVGEQIANRLLQAVTIADDPKALFWHGQRKLELLRVGRGLDDIEGGTGNLRQVEAGELQMELAGYRTRRIENVLD